MKTPTNPSTLIVCGAANYLYALPVRFLGYCRVDCQPD